ncbi:hypothetical protein pb186bvf_007739 [Paramecium bursaria]
MSKILQRQMDTQIPITYSYTFEKQNNSILVMSKYIDAQYILNSINGVTRKTNSKLQSLDLSNCKLTSDNSIMSVQQNKLVKIEQSGTKRSLINNGIKQIIIGESGKQVVAVKENNSIVYSTKKMKQIRKFKDLQIKEYNSDYILGVDQKKIIEVNSNDLKRTVMMSFDKFESLEINKKGQYYIVFEKQKEDGQKLIVYRNDGALLYEEFDVKCAFIKGDYLYVQQDYLEYKLQKYNLKKKKLVRQISQKNSFIIYEQDDEIFALSYKMNNENL